MSPDKVRRDKTVGVIGGMGPGATVDLVQLVIEATPAKDDADPSVQSWENP